LIVEVTKAIKSSKIFETISKEVEKTFKKFGITSKDVTKKIVGFIKSLTPKKIKEFFDIVRKKLEILKPYWDDFIKSVKETAKAIGEDFKREGAGIFTSIAQLILLALTGISEKLGVLSGEITGFTALLTTSWDGLSKKTKEFTGKLTGVTSAFLSLVGGITPLVLLGITLSSVFSALIKIKLAMWLFGIGGASAVLIGLAGTALLVGAAFATWKFGAWIVNLKDVEGGVTNLELTLSERVELVKTRLNDLKWVFIKTWEDIRFATVDWVRKMQGILSLGLSELVWRVPKIKDAWVGMMEDWHKANDGLNKSLQETIDIEERIRAAVAGRERGKIVTPPPLGIPPVSPLKVPTIEEALARRREMISTGEVIAELRKDAEARDEEREAFLEHHREERRKSEAFAENLRREIERDKANFEREKALMDTESE